MTVDSLAVDLDWQAETVKVGVIHFTYRRGEVATSWELAPSDVPVDAIDPTLRQGTRHFAGLPGALRDCSPDRWGRQLVDRRIRADAREQGRTAPTITEVDYLVGVSDLARQGALRLRHPGERTYLHPDHRVPRLVDLPRLLDASDRADNDLSAIRELLDAGSGSLGGARPKASVRDTGCGLALAKFPHGSDDWDVMGWEATALDLADRAGIDTPAHQLTVVDGRHVLILDRFDRDPVGSRIPFVSAMTLLSARDGDRLDYEDIAMHLQEHGGRDVTGSLADLYRRVALNVALHNVDDHLRNHGFLYSGVGWDPSPIFDVNPNPNPASQRVTSISGATHIEDEHDGLMAFAQWCRLERHEAERAVREVLDAVSGWREVATTNRVPKRELALFADMFDRTRHALSNSLKSSTHHVGSATVPGAREAQLRHPAGSPAGGQFAARPDRESDPTS